MHRLVALTVLLTTGLGAARAQDGFKPLFNGKDLTGWITQDSKLENWGIADGLLFTKIDETDRFGPLVNLLNETRARLTYLTTGQNVPQDIELADAVKMAELLLSETGS